MSWARKPVSELCILAVDCVNKTAPLAVDATPYKMLRTTNIKSGFIDFDTVRYVEEETFNTWTRRAQPQYGDVIFTREAPAGEVGRFTKRTGNYFLGQRLFLYRPDPNKLDWNYLAYVLQSHAFQGWVNGAAFGATVPHLKVADMEHLEIPAPPLSIQNKIGNILSAYDDLIENNNKRIQVLEEMAQRLYKHWFIDFKFPNHENTQFIQSERGHVPEGWAVTNLGNKINIRKGKNITKNTVVDGTVSQLEKRVRALVGLKDSDLPNEL